MNEPVAIPIKSSTISVPYVVEVLAEIVKSPFSPPPVSPTPANTAVTSPSFILPANPAKLT